jgi:two-component system response regulator FlrC
LERGAILAEGDAIEAAHLLFSTSPETASASHALAATDAEPASLRGIEKEAIRQALAAVDGHRKKAADRLGISLRSLYNKLKEYDLD